MQLCQFTSVDDVTYIMKTSLKQRRNITLIYSKYIIFNAVTYLLHANRQAQETDTFGYSQLGIVFLQRSQMMHILPLFVFTLSDGMVPTKQADQHLPWAIKARQWYVQISKLHNNINVIYSTRSFGSICILCFVACMCQKETQRLAKERQEWDSPALPVAKTCCIAVGASL